MINGTRHRLLTLYMKCPNKFSDPQEIGDDVLIEIGWSFLRIMNDNDEPHNPAIGVDSGRWE